MFVFVDESGDTGSNFEKGATPFFIVTAVTFQEEWQLEQCSSRIDQLRLQAGLSENAELHFTKSSNKVRECVLGGLIGCRFFYRAVVIDKRKLRGQMSWKDKSQFYEHTIGLVLDLWRTYLPGAMVDIDESGGLGFSRNLSRQISRAFTDKKGKPLLKRVRALDSKKSNLLQLADMVCGALAKSFGGTDKFRDLIKAKETEVIVRP